MLKPIVLRFSDDIPESLFLVAVDFAKPPAYWNQGEPRFDCKVFRVPKDGYMGFTAHGWATLRAITEFGMKKPWFGIATPLQVKDWLKCHPNEAKFRGH